MEKPPPCPLLGKEGETLQVDQHRYGADHGLELGHFYNGDRIRVLIGKCADLCLMVHTELRAYDELVDLFAVPVVAERILDFHPSSGMQARIAMLLERNRQGQLSREEQAELDEVERLEHFVRLIKARLRRKLRHDSAPRA